MKDTSFIDLTKEEILNKIVIDKRLINAFIKTMNNFQKYFNKMGYTKTRNYQEYFEKHILNSYYRLLIKCNKKPTQNDCSGFYKWKEKQIFVDENSLDCITDSINILTHEFIHFLVMNNSLDKKIGIDNILCDSPINEAMTEMLKLRMLPLTIRSYLPQIKMLKFYHIINNKEINFEDFLNKGEIKDIDYTFTILFNNYHNNSDKDYAFLPLAKNNPKYIKVQRYLLNNINVNVTNLEEYKVLIYKLAKKPIEDIYFMNRYYKFIERILTNNLNIKEKNIRNRFMLFIKEYRKILEYLYNSKNNRYIETFKIDDVEYEIDEKKNIYFEEQFLKKGKILNIKDEDIELDLSCKKLKKIKNNKVNNMLKLEEKANRIETILKYLVFISDNIEKDEKTLAK